MKKLLSPVILCFTFCLINAQGISCKNGIYILGVDTYYRLEETTASLLKEVANPVVKSKNLAALKTAVDSSTKKQPVQTKVEVTQKMMQNSSIFIIDGASSPRQYTSLQAAKLVFDFNCKATEIEMYKLETGTSTRSFSIPLHSNGNKAENIPVQISNYTESSPRLAGSYRHIMPVQGYLQPGEYVIIDKSTLSADGSRLGCLAFSVKQ
ncbi:MAG: hypothetical protein U0V75_11305 [Ferruginibacter sp.]